MAFVNFALELAALSTCKRRHKVGCVIYPPDFSEVYSIGYNGPAAGEPNDSCLDISRKCGCVHAEANALIKLRTSVSGYMIVTLAPCRYCAALILNSKRIHRLYYLEEHSTAADDSESGLDLLRRHIHVELF